MYLQKNKLYCPTLFACSMDIDAVCKNQKIGDERIVIISNVED